MPPFLYLLLIPIPFPEVAAIADDPSPGILRTNTEARGVDCEALSAEAARALHPGQVEEAQPRGAFIESQAMTCRHRFFKNGERSPRDEAILSRLSAITAQLASTVAATAPPKLTWQVESYYPDSAVASKIAFAAKVALVSRGQTVSDRVPVLAAGDLLVLGQQPPSKAYPLACARAFAEGALRDDEALMGVALIDSRETTLHAGICHRGSWRWVE